jgi:beta-glucosidase
VAVGNSHRDEGEWIGRSGGDRKRLTVAPEAEQLIAAVSGANPTTVVVLFGGSAFITDPWRHSVGALLAAWYPGMEGGRALADIVFGHEAPGGRLPCSWPASASQLPPFKRFARRFAYGPLHGYRLHEAQGTRPAYPFGFGLGYTTFEWGAPEVADRDAGGVVLRVALRNTGDRPGVEVVQGYVARALGTDARQLRTLRAFQKVALAPGASREVLLAFPLSPGDGAVWVGPSSDPDHLQAVRVDGP